MKLPYLHRPKPGHVWFRKGGRYLGRITAEEGTQEFFDQYWAFRNGKAATVRTSWAELIKSYRKSGRWAGLSARTRQDYERVILYLEEKLGSRDVRLLQRKHVIEAQAANAHRVRFANYIPQVLSILCQYAVDIGWRRDNPATGVRKLKVPKDRERAHIPWTDEAVVAFRAGANERARLIFEMGVGSVQRPGDWVAFNWGDYDGDPLRVTQGKTGVRLSLPCTPQLKAALDAARDELGAVPHPNRPILTNNSGERLTYRAMAAIMLAERRRLGLEAFDLHAMRYRGVMELAWAGCDDDEIMAFSGHKTKEMVRKYAGEARQIMRARQAAGKRR